MHVGCMFNIKIVIAPTSTIWVGSDSHSVCNNAPGANKIPPGVKVEYIYAWSYGPRNAQQTPMSQEKIGSSKSCKCELFCAYS